MTFEVHLNTKIQFNIICWPHTGMLSLLYHISVFNSDFGSAVMKFSLSAAAAGKLEIIPNVIPLSLCGRAGTQLQDPILPVSFATPAARYII